MTSSWFRTTISDTGSVCKGAAAASPIAIAADGISLCNPGEIQLCLWGWAYFNGATPPSLSTLSFDPPGADCLPSGSWQRAKQFMGGKAAKELVLKILRRNEVLIQWTARFGLPRGLPLFSQATSICSFSSLPVYVLQLRATHSRRTVFRCVFTGGLRQGCRLSPFLLWYRGENPHFPSPTHYTDSSPDATAKDPPS